MLIAHVEQLGVWTVQGGMHQLARAMEARARALGVMFHYGQAVTEVRVQQARVCGIRLADGSTLDAAAVVVNADPAALAEGALGEAIIRRVPRVNPARRSLSAVTWCLEAQTRGFPLSRHNVFFSSDYAAEFMDLQKRRRLPEDPTIYLCAQDREEDRASAPHDRERLFVLVNAPAGAMGNASTTADIAACEQRTFSALARRGLEIDHAGASIARTTPADFARLFPGSAGALYGQATHGWRASFMRPLARTALRGLVLAGGGVHPGAGVPMAVMSGRFAAQAAMTELSRAGRANRGLAP